jgi:hypothetical protein
MKKSQESCGKPGDDEIDDVVGDIFTHAEAQGSGSGSGFDSGSAHQGSNQGAHQGASHEGSYQCSYQGSYQHHSDERRLNEEGSARDGDLWIDEKSGDRRLFIFAEGQWGTVCDEAFTDSGVHTVDTSSSRNADVACRQLGFDFHVDWGTEGAAVPEAWVAESPIWVDNLHCSGDESSISECTRAESIGECSHSQDVHLMCGNHEVDTE